MQGKVVVFSGATSGIGEVSAVALAAQGARIVLIARSRARGEATLAKLRHAGPGQPHRVHYADLALISETKRVGAEISATESKIDVLINNAGALFSRRQMTEEGLERSFALNHMAYFVLTHCLIPHLGPDARIVNTASNAHRAGKLVFDDLQSERRYAAFSAYGASKLCNILFTRTLARRLAGSGITANCFHPGFVATRFTAEAGGFLVPNAARLFMAIAAISPEAGARTQIYLASSPAVAGSSGQYFHKCRPATPSLAARDDSAAEQLWVESARLTGIPA